MILAETESYLSRPIAPTRRIAIGSGRLPTDPAPGFGGILLGGIVARYAAELDPDTHDEVVALVADLERGRRVAQPRLRHRLQVDTVGLQRCRHRLVGVGQRVEFAFDHDKGTPLQHVLCAVYTAGAQGARQRAVFATLRKGLFWTGGDDNRLVAHLSGHDLDAGLDALVDPVRWALELLVLEGHNGTPPSRREVQRAFRDQLRVAHPDHGGESREAAERIRQLSEARRILLG